MALRGGRSTLFFEDDACWLTPPRKAGSMSD
jgi:hypothetical protein